MMEKKLLTRMSEQLLHRPSLRLRPPLHSREINLRFPEPTKKGNNYLPSRRITLDTTNQPPYGETNHVRKTCNRTVLKELDVNNTLLEHK